MIFESESKQKVDLRKGQLNIYRYYAINYPFFEMNFHSHEEWEIMYVVQGRCQVLYVENDAEKCCELREGDYILIRGMVLHRLSVKAEYPCRVLNLEGRMEPAEMDGCMHALRGDPSFAVFASDRRQILRGNDDGRIHDVLNALIHELKETEVYYKTDGNPMLGLLLSEFVLLLSRQYLQNRKNKDGGSIYCRKAQLYIEENFDREISVAEIAAVVGVSEGYLQRLYKKEKGIPIMEAVLRLRIEKAKVLLENSSLPVVDVAVNAGFNSRQHFGAMFARYTGCSPGLWRKRKGNLTIFHNSDINT